MRVEDETPAILKPDGDLDPRKHITFHMEVPVGLTPLGRKTIEVLGLDSPKHGLRRDYLEDIKNRREFSIHGMRSADPTCRNYAERERKFVEEAVQPDKPYSAMVIAYLEANPLPDLPLDVKCNGGAAPANKAAAKVVSSPVSTAPDKRARHR